MRGSVIVSAVRLPTGKFLGTLKSLPAPELGAKVVREAVARAGIEPELVDECIMGNVVSAGAGQAPARQAALKGGLGDHVAALTINKVCGSGLKSVMLAAHNRARGEVGVAPREHHLRALQVRRGDQEAVEIVGFEFAEFAGCKLQFGIVGGGTFGRLTQQPCHLGIVEVSKLGELMRRDAAIAGFHFRNGRTVHVHKLGHLPL